MPSCFVIQPFDGARFDKRYEDVFAPSIEASGLAPYRVDRDPRVSVPIDEIEAGIRKADACLADITLDNPNVWFELGYAIALHKEVVLVCSDERNQTFPFDVQHRAIIRYKTESPRDFQQLKSQIAGRLSAALQRKNDLGQIAQIQSISRVEGLEQYEIAVLVAVAEESADPASALSVYRISQAMEAAGFTKLAATLGIKGIAKKGLIDSITDTDFDGSTFSAYRLTDSGTDWLLANKQNLQLRRAVKDADDDGPPF